ncbi:MAG: hypothetical protein M3295_05380 [Chloroflexota bacterium]|nr:hypothetical protein [Chloroflexota bacterium]
MRRTQHAPRFITIVIAASLVLVGVLGTFAGVLPEAVGVWSYVAAFVLLLIGVFIPQI